MNRNICTATVIALLAVSASGCRSDPESDRLAMGSEAMLYSKEYIFVSFDGVEQYQLPPDEVFPHVPVGTKVVILADDKPDPKDPRESKLRKVRVSVKEGKFIGLVGEVTRWSLRPIAR